MKLFLTTISSFCFALLIANCAHAQTVQNIGSDPLNGDIYACAAFNPPSQNNIVVTTKKGKKKTLKIKAASENVGDHLSVAKKKLKVVMKLKKTKEKELKKLYESFTGPANVVKINKLEGEVTKLNLKVTQYTSEVELLTQLKKLINDCKDALPVTGSFQVHSGIIPPGAPGSGNYYLFIAYVFSPNVADHYCATLESFTIDKSPLRTLIKVVGSLCGRYEGLAECIDPLTEAAFIFQQRQGANKPGKCSFPEVCDLVSANEYANRYLADLKFYDVKPANGITSPSYCDTH